MEYPISERTRRVVRNLSSYVNVRMCVHVYTCMRVCMYMYRARIEQNPLTNDELSIATAIANVQRERSQTIRTSNRISRACVIFVKNVPSLAGKSTSRLPRTPKNGRKKLEDRPFSTKDPKKEETDYDERENREASSLSRICWLRGEYEKKEKQMDE